MTTYVNPCDTATKWVVWANTWYVTPFLYRLLFFFVFTFYLGSRNVRIRGWIVTIYTSYDVIPCKAVSFEGCIETAPHAEKGKRQR